MEVAFSPGEMASFVNARLHHVRVSSMFSEKRRAINHVTFSHCEDSVTQSNLKMVTLLMLKRPNGQSKFKELEHTDTVDYSLSCSLMSSEMTRDLKNELQIAFN